MEFIDLSCFIGDETKDLRISVAPISTFLSQRSQDILDYTKSDGINTNLLQVTIEDRAIVIELPKKDTKPQESREKRSK